MSAFEISQYGSALRAQGGTIDACSIDVCRPKSGNLVRLGSFISPPGKVRKRGWNFTINARSGDTTIVTGAKRFLSSRAFPTEQARHCVLPFSTTAGNWKQRLFPNDVAAWRKIS